MTVRSLADCHCTCILINWSVLRQSGHRGKGPIGRWAYWWRSTNSGPSDRSLPPAHSFFCFSTGLSCKTWPKQPAEVRRAVGEIQKREAACGERAKLLGRSPPGNNAVAGVVLERDCGLRELAEDGGQEVFREAAQPVLHGYWLRSCLGDSSAIPCHGGR